MQALGNYEGGRMLFLGLGTGLGSALIADGVIVPLSLASSPYPDGPRLDQVLGRRGLQRCEEVLAARDGRDGADPDGGVPGGLRRTEGNASELKELPPGARLGHNQMAFRGGSGCGPWKMCRRCRAMTTPYAAPRALEWRLI